MSGGAAVADETGGGGQRVGRVLDAVRSRALPSTQNRMAALIMSGEVFYRPSTATWFLARADSDAPTVCAQRGDGRALRTMRSTGLIRVDESATPDARGAYPVTMTDAGTERYRQH